MLLGGQVVDARLERRATAAVREVLRVVAKILVLEQQRGHGDSERLRACGRGARLKEKCCTRALLRILPVIAWSLDLGLHPMPCLQIIPHTPCKKIQSPRV